MRPVVSAAVAALLTLPGAAVGGAAQASGQTAPAPPILEGWSSGWYARIETSLGAMLVRLLPEQAPQTVAHFAALAEGRLPWTDPFTGLRTQRPYYDGLVVHKVVLAERFEAGDPTATGRGAPPIFVPYEGGGAESFVRPFRVGMTRSGLGRISGALFFVTMTAQPYLNGNHPCFGVVVEGRDVVERIALSRTDPEGRPLEPIHIERVRILRAGDPPPLPEPVHYEPETPKLVPLLPERKR